MSKCDLQIVFDRDDRRYRGGEEVSGTVHVRVNRDVQCNGLVLEHFWQTHGRGNTTRGKPQSIVLFKGQWRAGESFSYAFRFTVPNGPPTHRGRYLNIDHYVRARVDVPWAFDPNAREEYFLLPSGRPYGNRPRTQTQREAVKHGLQRFGTPLGIAMIVFGVLLLFPFGLVLIPLGCLLLGFSMRKILAERKLGKVALRFALTLVSPGGSVPLRLTFTPRSSSRLDGVTARLVGMERCVSGSGTNRSTHTHKFYDRTVALAGGRDVKAFERTQIDGAVQIPELHAYSFRATDNELIWTVDVRIDIPLWPDWTENRVLTVRPLAAAELVDDTVFPAVVVAEEPAEAPGEEETEYLPEEADTAVAPLDLEAAFAEQYEDEPCVTLETPAEEAAVEDAGFDDAPIEDVSIDDAPIDDAEFDDAAVGPAVPDQEVVPEAPPAESPPAEEPPLDPPAVEQPPAAAAASGAAALEDIVQQLETASRYGSEREKIVKEHAGTLFPCEIEIDKIERTYSYTPEERLRDGRTVTGVIAGTDCEVSLLMTAARNDELAALKTGSTLQANGTLLKWSSIYDRIEMQEE